MSPAYCYLNGEILPIAEAKVGVYDMGLLRGFGIYEAMVTANRRPFMFADHMARFKKSADRMRLKIPATDTQVENAISDLVAKNIPQREEAVIRFILTGGEAQGGIGYDYETPTFYILVEPLVPIDPRNYTDGCSLMMCDHQRQFPECKTVNYIQAVMLQQARKDAGAIEILYTSAGTVLECATSNFFIVSSGGGSASGGKDGTIVTAQDDILHGITRQVAIDVARPHFAVEERKVSISEMHAADEAFLTSSFKDVVPVVKVGDTVIGTGKVGPVTARVMELFDEFKMVY